MDDELFFVRLDADKRAVRLSVAEMAPDDVLAAIAWMERELQLAQASAAPALALLQRAANGERTMRARDLREAELMAATLLDVQQQTGRLREAVRQMRPAVAAD